MLNSPLLNKSQLLQETAQFLHKKYMYTAVPHATYYSCYQRLLYIWLYSMGKTKEELSIGTSQSRSGSHEFLLNEVARFIGESDKKNSVDDSRTLRRKLPQLKKLRTDADYSEIDCLIGQSQKSIDYSQELTNILKRY